MPAVTAGLDGVTAIDVSTLTTKLTPLLATPDTVTTTLPVVAPLGTVVAMLVIPQLVAVAVVPLNFMMLVPCVDPKLVPVIVIPEPIVPDDADRLTMLGVGSTVKLLPLLFTPLANTTTLPVVAPFGTVTAMVVAFQFATVAAVPLNFTVPVPCVDPKFVPVSVTAAPTAPVVIDRLVMLGAETTVKLFPLLATLDTVTTTFPVVAPVGTMATMLVPPQLVTVAAFPLNFTVLVPCVDPKFVPVIVTAAVTAPEVGETLVMVGAAPQT